MNLVIGISHPKQVYMFKNLILSLRESKNNILVIVIDKEFSSYLLDQFDIDYIIIGKNKKRILNKVFAILPLTIKTLIKSIPFKPDLFIGQAIPHIAYASFILQKPYLIFEDTESSKLLQKIVNPFARTIITPHSFINNLGKKQIRIKGSFELAYLRSNWFKPNPLSLKGIGLEQGNIFSIVRFVGWTANHDIGHNGLSTQNKIRVVEEFSKYGKVIISSEGPLPAKLEAYRTKFSISEIHSLMHFARLIYGESASMAAEAGYLGTPSIYLDNEGRGYANYLSDYELIYNFSESSSDQERSIQKGKEILETADKIYWLKQAEKVIKNSIDVGKFMIWFIENYPESDIIMKTDPDYQNRFE